MATEPLPFIEEDDYEAIRNIAPDLPDTYADWMKAHEQEKRLRNKINLIQEVRVGPIEFATFCESRAARGSREVLLQFALENAGPHETVQEYDPTDRD